MAAKRKSNKPGHAVRALRSGGLTNLATANDPLAGRGGRARKKRSRPNANGTNNDPVKPRVYRDPFSVLFITSNTGKLNDLRNALGPNGRYVHGVDLDVREVQGTHEEVLKHKLRDSMRLLRNDKSLRKRFCIHQSLDNTFVLVDDSALRVEACSRANQSWPGPYIKPFLKAQGIAGLARMVAHTPDKRAVAYCGFGFAVVKQSAAFRAGPYYFIEQVTGRILDAPRGTRGQGWDAIFSPDGIGGGRSVAQLMGEEEFLKYHQRYKAVGTFKRFLGSAWGHILENDNDDAEEKDDDSIDGTPNMVMIPGN